MGSVQADQNALNRKEVRRVMGRELQELNRVLTTELPPRLRDLLQQLEQGQLSDRRGY
jgi:hypothetical protein